MADLDRAVGLGAGLTTPATLWTGEQSPGLNAAGKAERKLRREQRALARRKGGSRGRQKAKRRGRAHHTKVKNTRKTYAYRMTANRVQQYDRIAVEDLNVRGMAQSHLAKPIHDTSRSPPLHLLASRAERADISFVRIAPKYSSQECSGCDARVKKSLCPRPRQRPPCGLVLDRKSECRAEHLAQGRRGS